MRDTAIASMAALPAAGNSGTLAAQHAAGSDVEAVCDTSVTSLIGAGGRMERTAGEPGFLRQRAARARELACRRIPRQRDRKSVLRARSRRRDGEAPARGAHRLDCARTRPDQVCGHPAFGGLDLRQLVVGALGRLVPEVTASLAAEMGAATFKIGLEQWIGALPASSRWKS